LQHLLHIAGVGPVVGVILGAKFGAIVFLLIPIVNIFCGTVHDYFSGMISMRNNAKSYLEISKKFLTRQVAVFSTIFMIIALFALSTSFTNVSAGLLNTNNIIHYADSNSSFILWICLIFLYYIFSTFFPIASFVSHMSYIFGTILIVSTVSIIFFGLPHIELLPEVDLGNFVSNFVQHPGGQPIFPMLFLTVACGMISGFHGSQNSITAGIIANEKNGRQVFFGMMVLEGFLAMIWAAVGIIGYQLYPELLNINNGPLIISKTIRGIVTIPYLSELILFSVVILAITTSDAALRTLRILISDIFKFQQRSSEDRFLLCLPILGACAIMVFWSNITDGFVVLWNYFSLTNQAIAVMCLAVSLCYMRAKKKPTIHLLCPTAFLSFMVFLYLFWISPEHVAGAPKGFGLGYPASCAMAGICSFLICWYCMKHGKYLSKLTDEKKFNSDEE
jgi:carbon starvation protein CstA